MLWIKRFICPHDGDEIFGLGEVDDVVRVAGEHLNSGDFFAGHLKFDDFAAADSALLNQTVTGNDDENFGLGVVPVLAADNAGAGDVDGDLACVLCLQQFRKNAAVINMHVQVVCDAVFGQIGQIGGIQFFCQRTGWNLRNHAVSAKALEAGEQVHNFAQCRLMRHGDEAVGEACRY